MWLLLQTFIKKLEIYNSDILIILDQYKCDKIDTEYNDSLNKECPTLIHFKSQKLFYYSK